MTRFLLVILIIFVSATPFSAAEKLYSPWFNSNAHALSPGALRILRSGQFTLLSLSPHLPAHKRDQGSLFHGFTILGKAKLPASPERSGLLRVLQAGIADSNVNPAYCFEPRHGIRATLSGEAIDLVICFACHQIKVYSPKESLLLTNRLPQPAFDRALKDSHLPRAKDN